MKAKLSLLALALLASAILACSIQVSLADPTATLPPPHVTIMEPTAPPIPPATPSFNDCADPAVATYLMEAEKLVLRYAKLSRQFQADFDAGSKEAMRLDLEDIQQIAVKIEALAPPPLYSVYHGLLTQEMKGFTDIMIAVYDGNADLAEAIATETDQVDTKRLAEEARINQFCRPPSLRKET